MTSPVRIHILTLGCPKNEVDSDRMRALVGSSAYRLVDDLDDADVAIVNTCAFIQEAVEESIDVVLDLTGEWRDGAPGRRIVVTGCMPSRYGDDLGEALTEADALVPVAEESALLATVERLTGVPAAAAAGSTRTASGPSAYLQVSDGCFRRCTYCTIPGIRGPYRSAPLAALVAEARMLAGDGAREIVLIGQDISAYGRDLDGPETLSDVIQAVCAIDEVAWVRLMYVQPDGATDELLDTMRSEPKVCHYLDMPLQHVSPHILRAMGRSGSAKEYLALVARIRDALPGVVLRTSLIAGFPGETDAQVEEVVDFLGQAQLDYAGVFVYSPEDGTAAADMAGLPHTEVRIQRSNLVRATADDIGLEKAAQCVGRTLDVLVEGVDEDGTPVGRWRGQAPDIDGVVLLDRSATGGDIVRVRITDALGYDLEGEIT
ncbi:MAG: 30S ribosomal protein S12 methylthiotransferase RimO [Actinomycetota bacterium]|nr:30S ribosomal protein S12 methylthiotransferase RimO [Actinomycetota bacterium]